MPTSRRRPGPRPAALAALLAVLLAGIVGSCDNPERPPTRLRLSIVSGDGQFSRQGTPLPAALVVLVRNADGSPARGVTVVFTLTTGAGTLSPGRDVTDADGIASSQLTLADGYVGPVRVRAALADDRDRFVEFGATSGAFYCPEEDPAFVAEFGATGDVMLLTRSSTRLESGGVPVAGVLRLSPNFGASTPSVAVTVVAQFEEATLQAIPRDIAFSRAGALFVAWSKVFDEVMRVHPDGTVDHLSFLEDPFGSELTTSPGAILVGCDAVGPFAVGCRDTLLRFSGAQYSGTGSDACNRDAVAVDPGSEDVFFVYLGDNTLRRLPLDTLKVAGPVQVAAALAPDEAASARGMVVNDDDGSVFILVDSDSTRALVRVTPGGTKSMAFDFFSRGAGDAAGRQRDLALDPRGAGVIYTIDTLNDVLIAYDILQGTITELVPDPLTAQPGDISRPGTSGDLLGIAVVP